MKAKNRQGVKYPKGFMNKMKKQKSKKIRNATVDKDLVEQEFNNAERVL